MVPKIPSSYQILFKNEKEIGILNYKVDILIISSDSWGKFTNFANFHRTWNPDDKSLSTILHQNTFKLFTTSTVDILVWNLMHSKILVLLHLMVVAQTDVSVLIYLLIGYHYRMFLFV